MLGHPQTAGELHERGHTVSQQAVTRSMDAAKPEAKEEEAAAEEAGYESLSDSPLDEEATWEELRGGFWALSATSITGPAFPHHQKQGPHAQPARTPPIRRQCAGTQCTRGRYRYWLGDRFLFLSGKQETLLLVSWQLR